MRACITGGTGFIGGALARRLLAEGVAVQLLARPSGRADQIESSGATVMRGDVENPDAVRKAIAGAEVVYHVAAKVEGPWTKEQFMETNVVGTEHVLDACRQLGTPRLVYLSSIAVYGPIAKGQGIDEETPFDEFPAERELYAQSKIAADQLVMEFARKTGTAVTILRPGIVFGPGRTLPLGLLAARLGKLAIVFGNRRQRMPLSYVENLVDAIKLAGTASHGGLREYIIVDDEQLTLGNYHAARGKAQRDWTVFMPAGIVVMAASSGLVPLKSGGFSKRQVVRATQDRLYHTKRIREELGWVPKIPLKEAIDRTLGAGEGF
jgi:nucleoside-diphosphate-sugar epimerase